MRGPPWLAANKRKALVPVVMGLFEWAKAAMRSEQLRQLIGLAEIALLVYWVPNDEPVDLEPGTMPIPRIPEAERGVLGE